MLDALVFRNGEPKEAAVDGKELRIERLEDQRGFRVVGDIDRSKVVVLADALAPEVEQGGDITLDLAQASFADNSGVGIIVSVAEDLGDRGDLILVLPEDSRDVLDLAAPDLPNLRLL